MWYVLSGLFEKSTQFYSQLSLLTLSCVLRRRKIVLLIKWLQFVVHCVIIVIQLYHLIKDFNKNA